MSRRLIGEHELLPQKCGRPRTSSRFCGGCGNDFGEVTVNAAESRSRPSSSRAAALGRVGECHSRGNTGRRTGIGSGTPDPLRPVGRWRHRLHRRGGIPARLARGPSGRRRTRSTARQPTSAPPPPPRLPPRPPRPRRRRTPGPPGDRPGSGKRAVFIIAVVLVVLAVLPAPPYALVSRSHTLRPRHNRRPTPPSRHTPAPRPPPRRPPSPTTSRQRVAEHCAIGVRHAEPDPDPYGNGPGSGGRGRQSGGTAGRGVPQPLLTIQSTPGTTVSTIACLTRSSSRPTPSQPSIPAMPLRRTPRERTLTGITDTGGGSLTANVSFTSHQNPADSPDQSACDDWQISVYLSARSRAPTA